MAMANKEITARELLHQIVREAEALIAEMRLGKEESAENAEVKLHMRAILLIGEAWGLPEEEIQKSLKLRLETEDCEPFDGKEGMEVQWGLFRTTVVLDTEEKRRDILELAKYSADFYGLDAYVD